MREKKTEKHDRERDAAAHGADRESVVAMTAAGVGENAAPAPAVGTPQCAAQRQEQPESVELRRAARRGDVAAQCLLGRCYDSGVGVTEDARDALRWFRLAAEQGLAEAQRC